MPRVRVRKNDIVKIMTGADKGKTGRVLNVFPRESRALVEGVRLVKRHVRPNPRLNVKGGIVQKEAAVRLSNLMVVCPECSKPARMGVKILADGRRLRTCKRCQGEMER